MKLRSKLLSLAELAAVAALACTSTARAQPMTATGEAAGGTPYLLVHKANPVSGVEWEMHLVLTKDEIYVPIGLRRPAGNGPFPIILLGSGQGRDGVTKIETSMTRYEGVMTRMLERGYAAAFVSYRNEVPELYNQIDASGLLVDDVSGTARRLQAVPTLDSDDYISIVEHVRSLPYVGAVGGIGSSHSGEIILKAAAVMDLAAAVPSEAAAIEFLGIDAAKAPRDPSGAELQLQDKEVVRALADKPLAMRRIEQIDTPLLILGRDDDHLQGIFALAYEWLSEAGADVTWATFDHPEHGYSLMERTAPGAFEADAVEQEVFDLYMVFFDTHLR
jgi:hypothetical protein